ncbi:hypothetical protein D3C80_1307470 [compost metagenome]
MVDQPLDGFAAVLDGETHRILAAQAGAGGEGVLHVRFDVVAVVEYRRHAALGPVGRAAGEVALAQHGHAQVRRQVEGEGQAGAAAADDQYVVLIVLAHVRRSAVGRALVYRRASRHNINELEQVSAFLARLSCRRPPGDLAGVARLLRCRLNNARCLARPRLIFRTPARVAAGEGVRRDELLRRARVYSTRPNQLGCAVLSGRLKEHECKPRNRISCWSSGSSVATSARSICWSSSISTRFSG